MPRGGKRPGAGRKAEKLSTPMNEDPRAFLLAVMNDPNASAKTRLDAARSLMPYEHARKGESGKKESRRDAAEEAARGRYGAQRAPKLALVKSA